jgi:hypothetical protein
MDTVRYCRISGRPDRFSIDGGKVEAPISEAGFRVDPLGGCPVVNRKARVVR